MPAFVKCAWTYLFSTSFLSWYIHGKTREISQYKTSFKIGKMDGWVEDRFRIKKVWFQFTLLAQGCLNWTFWKRQILSGHSVSLAHSFHSHSGMVAFNQKFQFGWQLVILWWAFFVRRRNSKNNSNNWVKNWIYWSHVPRCFPYNSNVRIGSNLIVEWIFFGKHLSGPLILLITSYNIQS